MFANSVRPGLFPWCEKTHSFLLWLRRKTFFHARHLNSGLFIEYDFTNLKRTGRNTTSLLGLESFTNASRVVIHTPTNDIPNLDGICGINEVVAKRMAKKQQSKWHIRVRIACCKPAPRCSMATCRLRSSAGIREHRSAHGIRCNHPSNWRGRPDFLNFAPRIFMLSRAVTSYMFLQFLFWHT